MNYRLDKDNAVLFDNTGFISILNEYGVLIGHVFIKDMSDIMNTHSIVFCCPLTVGQLTRLAEEINSQLYNYN